MSTIFRQQKQKNHRLPAIIPSRKPSFLFRSLFSSRPNRMPQCIVRQTTAISVNKNFQILPHQGSTPKALCQSEEIPVGYISIPQLPHSEPAPKTHISAAKAVPVIPEMQPYRFSLFALRERQRQLSNFSLLGLDKLSWYRKASHSQKSDNTRIVLGGTFPR